MYIKTSKVSDEFRANFVKAIKTDLARLKVTETSFAASIGITQQSFKKWRVDGCPPVNRIGQMLDYFGPESNVAKIDYSVLIEAKPKVSDEFKEKFVTAIKTDIANLKITETSFATSIGIQQQSFRKWIIDGYPPVNRIDQMLDYFGPNSNVAKIDFSDIINQKNKIKIVRSNDYKKFWLNLKSVGEMKPLHQALFDSLIKSIIDGKVSDDECLKLIAKYK
jgi:DNA-binding transcriptional regulator YiaG